MGPLRTAMLVLAAALAGGVFPAAARAEGLPRVASASLCADQYLMMLADRSQVASVTWQSQSILSHYAEAAEGLPQNRGTAEELLSQDVSVVIMDDWGDRALKAMLARFGVEVIELPLTDDFDAMEDTVRRVAAVLGREARGAEVIERMRAQRAALAEARGQGPHPQAAYYRRDGGGAAAGTFVDTVLTAAGFRNLQSELGQVGYENLTLERALIHPPDVYVTSFFDSAQDGVRTAFANNPVLWELLETTPRIEVPGALWVCASPLLLDAARFLADKRLELFAAQGGAGS